MSSFPGQRLDNVMISGVWGETCTSSRRYPPAADDSQPKQTTNGCQMETSDASKFMAIVTVICFKNRLTVPPMKAPYARVITVQDSSKCTWERKERKQ